MKIECTVNGQVVTADVATRQLLSDFLRHELRLTGTHVGCEAGVCGACTVIVDGEPVRSCLMFAVQTDGSAIDTVECLASAGRMSSLQESFHRNHGLQCGYCTPGILMTVEAMQRKGVLPATEHEVRDLLSGHLCRCTGYQHIVESILAIAP